MHHVHAVAAAVVSGSLGSDSRWPHFGGRVARMGVHSALSLPLVVGDQVIGAINSYAYSRDAFGEHAVQLGSQFAGPAAVSVYNAQLLADAQERTKQLQRALGSRAVIDQAIGIIRSRSGGSAEEAFDRLARLSQAENVKLRRGRRAAGRGGGAARPCAASSLMRWRRGQFGDGRQQRRAGLPIGHEPPCNFGQVVAVGACVGAQQRESLLDGDVEALAEEALGLLDDDAADQRGA